MVRFKNRYITIEVEPVKIPKTNSWELDTGKLYKAIVNTLSTLHGDFGVASTTGGFSVKYCNKETKIGIIRCRHGPHKLIASIIPFIKQIDNNQVQLNTLYTGATLHQCYKFIKIMWKKM
ncbi:POP5 ribonuclease P/MRP subunit isoform X2 [Lycorma delicatula]|uniref:POP5 ribonuclease P/MRP subunit isoform X2 n=1 Tax=Lycorma delicatula TaxID=130591 RepID=UPI003F51442C